jgi:carboxylesterase
MHGFSGSVSEVRELGQRIHAAGFGVLAPTLAGHGTKSSDLCGVSANDFLRTAEAAYEEAAARFARVYLVGLSMGGTLALHLAARRRVAALVTISTPVFMSRLVSWSVPVAKRLMPRRNVISNYAAWRGEVVGYRSTPLSSVGVFLDVLATVKDDLHRVRAPILIIHSTGDQTVPLSNAAFIASRVASSEKTVRVHRDGRHLLTLPPHLGAIETEIVAFFRAREAPYATGAAASSKGATR